MATAKVVTEATCPSCGCDSQYEVVAGRIIKIIPPDPTCEHSCHTPYRIANGLKKDIVHA